MTQLDHEAQFQALAATYPPPAPDAPLIVLIEDDASAILNIRMSALDLGCAIEVLTDLADGEARLFPLLEREAAYRPVLVIVDQQMPFNNVFAQVDGWVLIGMIMEQMLEQRIPPVLMVALSADMTDERRELALTSGAYAALAKPLYTNDIAALLEQASDGYTAANIVANERHQSNSSIVEKLESGHRRTVRTLGQHMLGALQRFAQWRPAAPQPQWSAKSVAVLAKRPTDPERIELIAALGGQARANELLNACITALEAQERSDGGLQASAILSRRINGASMTELEYSLGFARAYLYRREAEGWAFVANWLNEHVR